MELQHIVAGRAACLDHAVRALSAENPVVGIFLGGSLGAEAGDAFSDIDLRVVVESARHAEFVRRRLEIPKSWPGFLFNEWIPGTQHCVSHFEPFGKIDIFYLDDTQLEPTPWYGLPMRVLYDPQGRIANLIEQSRGMAFDVSVDQVERSISKGLAAIHEALRRSKRGELFYAQTLLDELRRHMMMADDWLFERTPMRGVPKFDERGSDRMREALEASYCRLEGGAIALATIRLGRVYRELVLELHDMVDLGRPLENDLRAFETAEAAFLLPEIQRRSSAT